MNVAKNGAAVAVMERITCCTTNPGVAGSTPGSPVFWMRLETEALFPYDPVVGGLLP